MEQMTMFNDVISFNNHKKYRDGLFLTHQELDALHREHNRDRIYRILSFGGGTQSAVLLDLHLQGVLHYDAIFFADTGAEPKFIHDQVAWWKQRQLEVGNTTPFFITRHHKFEKGIEEMLMRYIHTDYQRLQLPLFCNAVNENGEEVAKGILPRQCTVDFKIVPVKQAARLMAYDELQISPRKRLPKNVGFIIDIGFALDEINRISSYESPQYKYMYLGYPLVERNMTVQESIEYLVDRNYPLKRSRCYLCPFNCDDPDSGMEWAEIIASEPFSFLKAVYFDDHIRRVQAEGKKYLRSIPYFHKSRMPLKEIYSQDYKRIKSFYDVQLQEWIRSWMNSIKEKCA